MSTPSENSPESEVAAFAESPPGRLFQLLFLHHSCGGQLLAAPGPAEGKDCIYRSHPNGGGLRERLEKSGYLVHEASYHSRIGQDTNIFDWLPKFRDNMEQVLTCDRQDIKYQDTRRNNIVVFKSCYSGNAFRSEGSSPGNPNGPDLTLWNAKAAFAALPGEFRKYPEVLFVYVTAPPLAPKTPTQPLWKRIAKALLGWNAKPVQRARLARQFNNWLVESDGWLKDGNLNNVAVFDYYDILTDHGMSDLSAYPTGGGCDSHPSREGNEKAAAAFVPFLNRAVGRMGLSWQRNVGIETGLDCIARAASGCRVDSHSPVSLSIDHGPLTK